MPRNVNGTLFSIQTRCYAFLFNLPNGTQYGLTDASVPFTYLGVNFSPMQGGEASNLSQESGTSTQNMEIRSLLEDSLNLITKADLTSGRYEGCNVWVYEVDWTNPSANNMIVGRYRMQKLTLRDVDWSSSLVGIEDLLKNQIHRVMESKCDRKRFGDKSCDPTQTLRAALTFGLPVCQVPSLFTVDFDASALTGPSALAGFFASGDGLWTAGNSDTVAFEIKQHFAPPIPTWLTGSTYSTAAYVVHSGSVYISLVSGNTGNTPGSSPDWLAVPTNPTNVARILLATPMQLQVQVGDTANLCWGCDRMFSTCQAVQTVSPFANNLNFGGFPGLPDPDLVKQVGRQATG